MPDLGFPWLFGECTAGLDDDGETELVKSINVLLQYPGLYSVYIYIYTGIMTYNSRSSGYSPYHPSPTPTPSAPWTDKSLPPAADSMILEQTDSSAPDG